MRICIFEDPGWSNLAPLTLTRPTFELRCGTRTLRQRQQDLVPADETGVWVRPVMAELCRLDHPEWHVNDAAWLSDDKTILINSRWLPLGYGELDTSTPHVGILRGELAYAVLPRSLPAKSWSAPLDWHVLQHLQQALPERQAAGAWIRYPWDLVENNAAALAQDHAAPSFESEGSSGGAMVVGPRDRLHIAPSARVELAVLDTTGGPIFLEDNVVVQAFSRIEGPCAIAAGSAILGARVSGSSIGPCCKIGGEVEASIIQGFSNKAHEGFLGHSYLGEWVNLGAGTQFSDLRNDYRPVTVRIDDERVCTDRLKVGSFIGDFARTGLNTLFNTGSFVGAFCNLPSSSGYLPRNLPSFTQLRHGQLQEAVFDSELTTARLMMNRRGRELTAAHSDLYRAAFEETRWDRDETLRQQRVSV